MQVSSFNYISSDVFIPLTDRCPGQLPGGLPLTLALVDLNGNFFGALYTHVYDPLAALKAIEINQTNSNKGQ